MCDYADSSMKVLVRFCWVIYIHAIIGGGNFGLGLGLELCG